MPETHIVPNHMHPYDSRYRTKMVEHAYSTTGTWLPSSCSFYGLWLLLGRQEGIWIWKVETGGYLDLEGGNRICMDPRPEEASLLQDRS